MKKKRIYIILLILGILTFVIPLLYGIYSLITGFSFMFTHSTGIEAFINAIVVYSFLYWPTYIIGILLIIISIIKLKK